MFDNDDDFTIIVELRELAYEGDNVPIGHRQPLISESWVTLANRATHRVVVATVAAAVARVAVAAIAVVATTTYTTKVVVLDIYVW